MQLTRCFSFVDIEYLKSLFSEGGVIEYMKHLQREAIEAESTKISGKMSREQRRANQKETNKSIKEAIRQSDKGLYESKMIIDAFERIVPYKRILVSSDGYLIPMEEHNFRVKPNSLGFIYGGEMKCIGMITSIIGEHTGPIDKTDIFSIIQFSVNEMMRIVMPTKEKNLYVISPLAVYYE